MEILQDGRGCVSTKNQWFSAQQRLQNLHEPLHIGSRNHHSVTYRSHGTDIYLPDHSGWRIDDRDISLVR